MHELATVTIWFSLYILGALLTLLMPALFPEPSRIARKQDDQLHGASYEGSEGEQTLATMVCCGPSHEGLDFQTCCPSAL